MPRRKTAWICDRRTAGIKCATRNELRLKLCKTCGKPRPAVKKKKHMQSLNTSYEAYVELNGGEHCGICGITREELKDPSRKLDRDHGHDVFGAPRGLLCRKCNMKLGYRYSLEWMKAAVAYLERVERRDGVEIPCSCNWPDGMCICGTVAA